MFLSLDQSQVAIPRIRLSGGNNGVIRPGRCGAQSAVLGPEGREMKFSIKY
jgi:hypothetical protein